MNSKGKLMNLNDRLRLVDASREGRLEVVRSFVESDVDMQGIRCDLAIQLASKRGHLQVVKLLTEKGVDNHANNDLALRWASKYGHLDVVDYLLSLKSKIYWLTHNRKSVREIYKEYNNDYGK